MVDKIKTLSMVLNSRILNKKYPLIVNIRPTNRCNFRCDYCKIWNEKEDELTAEQYFKLFDEFKKLGIQKLGITGGEPMLRNDINRIIDYAHKLDMMVSLSSNGWLINESTVDKIKNLDLLTLSLDGREETHDRHRREGSYKKVMEAIKAARANGIKVWTITVLHKDNINQIDFLIDLAEKMDFRFLFQPVFYHALTGNINDLYPPKEEFRKAINNLIKYKKKGRPIASSFSTLKYMTSWADSKITSVGVIPHKKFDCQAGRLFWTLTPNGNLYPCADAIGHVKGVNVIENGVKKAMELSQDYAGRCAGCWMSCYVEYSALFSFKMGAVRDAFVKLGDKGKK